MHLESILRRLQPQPGFVYDKIAWAGTRSRPSLHVHLRPRHGARGICSRCCQKRPGYDVQQPPRLFTFVPLWGIAVLFVYAMRRVDCRTCGVTVEMVPWAAGKTHSTHAFVWFVSSWARVVSWTEVARRFYSSWDTVFRCVEHAVRWGLEHRKLDGIRSIGVDELAWKKGHKYLTLVYQIDHGRRRLLHIAQKRTATSFNAFFDMLGEERSKAIAFVASDMWKAFLGVVRKRCSLVLHVLDRFHVAQLLSKAVDTVRREEMRGLRAAGRQVVLTKTRWLLLKRPKNLTRKERVRLRDLVTVNLRSVRAYLLKEQFQHFWTYTSVDGGRRFLKRWTTMAMRSRLQPFRKFAKTTVVFPLVAIDGGKKEPGPQTSGNALPTNPLKLAVASASQAFCAEHALSDTSERVITANGCRRHAVPVADQVSVTRTFIAGSLDRSRLRRSNPCVPKRA